MKTRHATKSAGTAHCGGFTLVELLVVIVVLLVVLTMTLVLVNQTTKDDKIAAASRQVQSMLEGARARSLQAREPRGVRFLRHPNDPDIITSMVYIGSPGKYSEGQLRIVLNRASQLRQITGVNWLQLETRRLLFNGARIGIKVASVTHYFAVQKIGASWVLTKDFVGIVNTPYDYELELAPTILPNQEPRELPDGVVIDFDHSSKPTGWLSDRDRMDILFSPRGTVIGHAASKGHVHLLISGLGDVSGSPHKNPGDDTKEDAETIVTVTTNSGSISTHSVYPGDTFRYAESGVETK